jgi:DNA-directed RNA polymerase specialized sigma24 family protein
MAAGDDPTAFLMRLRSLPEEQVRWINAYSDRLLRLATQHMRGSRDAGCGPEDVLQSVFKSFFTRTIHRPLDIRDPDDLAALLCTMTLNKCVDKIRRQTAGKRDRSRLLSIGGDDDGKAWGSPPVALGDPTAEAQVLVEFTEELLTRLPTRTHRRVAELLLAGHSPVEIGPLVNRAARTVRRLVQDIKRHTYGILDLPAPAGPDHGE